MRTAVLIDGGFFLKRFPYVYPSKNADDPAQVARTTLSLAVEHVMKVGRDKSLLYRVFFYDCPPFDKKMSLPVSGDTIDFAKTAQALFRLELHSELRKQRKMALRLGRLSQHTPWQLKQSALDALRHGQRTWSELTDDDFQLDVRQKAVDMKIGLDIASLAHKRLVDQVVLVAGDADFVPAAKLARREGIDFILDPLWQGVSPELYEHIDGLQSVCPRPLRTPFGIRQGNVEGGADRAP